MNITSTIITASDGTPLSLYDVCRFLSKQQWRHILKLLEQEGIHKERIEAYDYPEARDTKHLFIRFKVVLIRYYYKNIKFQVQQSTGIYSITT